MAFVPEINGVKTVAPLPIDQQNNALDKDSGRTANGTMVRYVIGDKVKLSFEYRYIPKAEGRKILKEIKKKSCAIKYEDSELGVVTKNFYVVTRDSKLSTVDGLFEYIRFNATEI